MVSLHGEAGQRWLSLKVVDARPIIDGEVWLIRTKSLMGSIQTFYVLEDTCEVIGHTPDSTPELKKELPLRADWTAYIEMRLTTSECGSGRWLIDLLQCENSEDFDRGVSKAWLKHLKTHEDDGDARLKYAIAQKYVLSSVVSNGYASAVSVTVSLTRTNGYRVSGEHITQQRMRAEWSGNPDSIPSVAKPKPSINLFLPE